MADENFFVAVVPPDDVCRSVADLPTRSQRGVRFTRAEQWHFTLCYLGAAELGAALGALAAVDHPAVTVAMGDRVELLGTRVVMVPATGLDALAAAVAGAFDGVGEPQPDRAFRGHLTLARLKGAPLKNPSSVSVLGHPFDATFVADAIALIKSETTNEGATYTVIAERSLPAS